MNTTKRLDISRSTNEPFNGAVTCHSDDVYYSVEEHLENIRMMAFHTAASTDQFRAAIGAHEKLANVIQQDPMLYRGVITDVNTARAELLLEPLVFPEPAPKLH